MYIEEYKGKSQREQAKEKNINPGDTVKIIGDTRSMYNSSFYGVDKRIGLEYGVCDITDHGALLNDDLSVVISWPIESLEKVNI